MMTDKRAIIFSCVVLSLAVLLAVVYFMESGKAKTECVKGHMLDGACIKLRVVGF
jgi:hypothetical protein